MTDPQTSVCVHGSVCVQCQLYDEENACCTLKYPDAEIGCVSAPRCLAAAVDCDGWEETDIFTHTRTCFTNSTLCVDTRVSGKSPAPFVTLHHVTKNSIQIHLCRCRRRYFHCAQELPGHIQPLVHPGSELPQHNETLDSFYLQ